MQKTMNWPYFVEHFPRVASALCAARRSGHLAHAYLIHADTEESLEKIPMAIAELLACTHLNENGAPCGTCQACTALANGNYAQFFKLAPVSKSRMIRVGDDADDPGTMRYFEAQFYLTASSENSVKIGWVQNAECLNEQGQNAFLKTLEEPPPQSFIMLSTRNPAKLLPTIRSRCQTLCLLQNQVSYTQFFVPELVAALDELRFNVSHNLPGAERVAQRLIDLSKSLQQHAADEQKEFWDAEMQRAGQQDWDSAECKNVEERMAAAVRAAYLGLRESFTGAIYDTMALAYEQALGVPAALLQNPELHVVLEKNGTTLNEKSCLAHLKCAEQLLQNLAYNVSEELALRVFALKTAFAGEA